MALFEITYVDGSVGQVRASSPIQAKVRAKALNDCAVKSAVQIRDNDDDYQYDDDCDEYDDEPVPVRRRRK